MTETHESSPAATATRSKPGRSIFLLGGALAVIVASGVVDVNGDSYRALYTEFFAEESSGCTASTVGCPSQMAAGCCLAPLGGEEEAVVFESLTPLEAPRPADALVRTDAEAGTTL